MTVNEMDREGMLGTAVTNEPKKQASDESKMENPAILISSASKYVEKKRRRSHSSEALVGEAQDEVPSKIRKVEEEEYEDNEMKGRFVSFMKISRWAACRRTALLRYGCLPTRGPFPIPSPNLSPISHPVSSDLSYRTKSENAKSKS